MNNKNRNLLVRISQCEKRVGVHELGDCGRGSAVSSLDTASPSRGRITATISAALMLLFVHLVANTAIRVTPWAAASANIAQSCTANWKCVLSARSRIYAWLIIMCIANERKRWLGMRILVNFVDFRKRLPSACFYSLFFALINSIIDFFILFLVIYGKITYPLNTLYFMYYKTVIWLAILFFF